MGLRRSTPEPDTLAAGSAPAYPFFVDRGGYCIQFNPHPCNNHTHPFLHYPSANSDGGVDCCVIYFVLSQFPSPISCNLFMKKSCELWYMGQSYDPRPSSTSGNSSPQPIDCCVYTFGGSLPSLGELEPPNHPRWVRKICHFGRILAAWRSIRPHTQR